MMKKITSIFIFGLTFWFFGHFSVAHAQSVNLSISPPVVEILIAPNKKVSQTFNLQFEGDSLTVIPEIHAVKPMDTSGHVTVDPNPIKPADIPLTITSINHVLGVPFTVQGNTVPITLSFEAASSDTSQDVYLALVLKAVPAEITDTSSVTTPAISALILATITPDGILPINLEVGDFSLPIIHDSWDPITITPTLVNHNPIMIRPLGTYEVISPGGKTILSIPLYPNLILGNASRVIEGSHGSTSTNTSPLPLPLSWSPTWYNIGPYRVHLTITSQGGTKLTDIEKVVWVLPIRIILGTIFFILITILLLYKKTISPKQQIDSDNKDQ